MVFRWSFLLGAISLALVPFARAGEKIEFSAPSSEWSVPQQEQADNNKEAATALRFSSQPSAIDETMMAEFAPTTYYVTRSLPKKPSFDDSDQSANGFNNLAGGITNAWRMRAWDADPMLSMQRREDAQNGAADAAKNAFNPFARGNSREGGFMNSLSDSEDSSFNKSYWQLGSHSSSALERMRAGQFVPFSEPAPEAEASASSSASSYAPTASYGDYASSPDSVHPFFSSFNHDGESGITPQGPIHFGQEDPQVQRAALRAAAAVADSYVGTRKDPPPAVLKFPPRPGSLFQ